VLTVEGRAQLAEKQVRVEQLQASYKTYDEIRANLSVLGKPSQFSSADDDPRLQAMKATISLYQNTYIQLLSDLETTRLARLQQTPNAAQIQEASAPKRPVRPIPLLYSLLSGVVGLLLAGAPIIFLSVFRAGLEVPGVGKVGKSKRTRSKQNPNQSGSRLTEQPVSPDRSLPK
jgi:uncharacterized protein involved in exopolysaccharide biosynthesis